jgi:hypothetical protein
MGDQKRRPTMSESTQTTHRVRVVLAVDETVPEEVRADIDESLEAAGWMPASDRYDCWVCRARIDEIEKIERRVRKVFEFAAFTAGFSGRITFALKLGELSPRSCELHLGDGGRRTRHVVARNSGVDFATERVPNGGVSCIPSGTQLPEVTSMKTAF